MSTEDLTQTGLRVGGWLPPFQAAAALRSDSRAVPYRSVSAGPARRSGPPASHCAARRGAGGPLVCLTVLATTLAGLTVTFLPAPWPGSPAPSAVRLPSVPQLLPAIPVLPSEPGPSGNSARDLHLTAVRRPGPAPAASSAHAGAASGSSGAGSGANHGGAAGQAGDAHPPVTAELAVGATIGLELSGWPGYRVRHRDFLGRVDRIDHDSSALDRADSRFIVRAARDGCVALESVNYPGRFLRHRNFVLHLDRRDGTALFTADSTFCPMPRRGGALALRSYNYPDRFVTQRDSMLTLTSTATSFVVRPPL